MEIQRSTAARAAAAVAGYALIAWASLDDHDLLSVDPRTFPGINDARRQRHAPSGTPTTTAHPSTYHGGGGASWTLPDWAVVGGAIAVATAIAGVLVYVVAKRLAPWLSERTGPSFDAGPTDLDSLVQQAAARQVARLLEGTPRNGIVATWVELERLVESAGYPRRATETSSELVVRVLADAQVPGDALTGLNDLYREARFSSHDLTEEHRRRAATCLAQMHEALGVRAASPGAGGEAG